MRPVSAAVLAVRPRCSSVISSGTSAPTSPPISAVLTASTQVEPPASSTNANTAYNVAADRPPMMPSSASTAMNVMAACASSGLTASAPAPNAAM